MNKLMDNGKRGYLKYLIYVAILAVGLIWFVVDMNHDSVSAVSEQVSSRSAPTQAVLGAIDTINSMNRKIDVLTAHLGLDSASIDTDVGP